jgi:hypothetical protein
VAPEAIYLGKIGLERIKHEGKLTEGQRAELLLAIRELERR